MYNPWLALAVTLAIFALISTPIFRGADAPPGHAKERRYAIDGLRGLAAFGVYLHHALINHDFLKEGVWRLPPSRFFSVIGEVGVSVFFLITGYLFWAKLLNERGRSNWIGLYVGRIFRIGPVYSLALAGILCVVFVKSGGAAMEPLTQIVGELAKWLCLGMYIGVPINADPLTNVYIAGVAWSLQYEWAFYAALFILSVGAMQPRWAPAFSAVLIVVAVAWWYKGGIYWLRPYDPIFALLFALGIGCATLEQYGWTLKAPRWILSACCLGLVIATFVFFPNSWAFAPTMLLGISFFLVISGADFIGLLRSRPARRLGDISFGIYMLQGLALTAAFSIPWIRSQALTSDMAYWFCVLTIAAALIFASMLAHVHVELPGIRAGRSLVIFASRRMPTMSIKLTKRPT